MSVSFESFGTRTVSPLEVPCHAATTVLFESAPAAKTGGVLPTPPMSTASALTASRSGGPEATVDHLILCLHLGVREDGTMSDAFTTRVLNVASGSRERVVDLTRDCEAFLREAAAGRDGLLNVFVPHATAGIAIIETGAGSDDDLLAALHTLLPADDRWQHRHGSPGHGRDHVLPAFVPPHATLPVVGGSLQLGTWQSVCLVDTNISKVNRQVRLSFLG